MDVEPSGQIHLRYRQVWQGVEVYGAEAAIHMDQEGIYLFNGRFFPSPELENVAPALSQELASQAAFQHVGKFEPVTAFDPALAHITGGKQSEEKLVIYHPEQKHEQERLCWHVTLMPNMTARYSYFIDALTGEVVHYYSELCKLTGHVHAAFEGEAAVEDAPHTEFASPPPPDGPYQTDADDLFGQSREINTYCKNNVFYLIDASQTMFNGPQSVFPDDPVGTIWTVNAQNTSPENSNFSLAHVTSNNNSWNNPKAISAHYHGEKAYDYFKGTFQRESINGQGGNIISMINVVESNNSQMDNAFWNGFAMFYGNGNQAFSSPLCKALDVAGHEMSHGVIQSTANLEYMGESGALNESFADVFGAMIDRNDWKMGEDVVNTSVFSSGALRDLSNPHNGGNDFNDAGYQPAHYSERYTGSQDNGGVHINSGIPNKAFQLFADAITKDKAEQVYYRALDLYLLKSSNFVDCRNAIVQAADDLYGTTEVNAANAAFTAVGIGAGAGTDPQTDIDTNPGDDFILMSDADFAALYIFTPTGEEIANPLTTLAPISRPSITDDGSAIVYVADDNTLRGIFLDWNSGEIEEFVVQNEPIWRNVAVSKKGERLAALTTDNDNILWIYDYGLAQWFDFELFNPTTGQGAPTTGDVVYADVIEWDFSGEWVIYDAFNELNSTTGAGIQYWDIGFIEVFSGNNFASGHIEKLYSGLPEGVSIGNPTFSKNSDYIIAFDYLDEFSGEYFLLGVNIQEGETGTIFENVALSWPNFSVDDNRLVFEAEQGGGTPVLAFINLASNKITASGNATVYIEQGRWGVWFANGDRLIHTDEIIAEKNIRVYPNPTEDMLNLDFISETSQEATLQVFDLMGREMEREQFMAVPGENHRELSLAGLSSGQYFVRVGFGDGQAVFKVMKK